MTSIHYTISTRTPKAQDALVNRVLDFETGLMVSATSAVIREIKSELVCGTKTLSDFKPERFKTPLAKRFNISTTTAYCCAVNAISMYKSRDTNSREQYLPKAKSVLEKAQKTFKSLKRQLRKAKGLYDSSADKMSRNRALADVNSLRMKLAGSNRRVQIAKARVERLEREIETLQYSICIGSKRQFKAQNELKKNGYERHSDWLRDFRYMRATGVYLIGDPTAKGGGRQFKILRDKDGYQLHFTLSNAARKHFESVIKDPQNARFFTANTILIRDVEFSRKQDVEAVERVLSTHNIRNSRLSEFKQIEKDEPEKLKLAESRHLALKGLEKRIKDQRKNKSLSKERKSSLGQQSRIIADLKSQFIYTANQYSSGTGCSISPKFLRDAKGWRFDISFSLPTAEVAEDHTDLKVIGVDTNYDHFAVSVIGEKGEFETSATLPFTHPDSNKINNDLFWIQARAIVDEAKASGATIALESLQFSKKKQELYSAQGKSYNRMLSSFAFTKMTDAIKRRALEAGVRCVEVNPSYTSFIGRALFSDLTESIHESAAYVIALKAQNRFLESLKQTPNTLDLSCFNIAVNRKGREIGLFTEHTYRSAQVEEERNKSLVKIPDLFSKFKKFETEQYRQSRKQTRQWRDGLIPSKRKAVAFDAEMPF